MFVLIVSYFFDHVFNGVFVEWFASNFTWTESDYAGNIYTDINWNRLKTFLITAFFLFCLVLAFAIPFLKKQQAKKQSVK